MHATRLEPIPPHQRIPLQITPNDRPTLLFLRRGYNRVYNCHLTSRQVADAAGVPLWVYFQAEIGCPVSREDAEKILPTLSRLIGLLLTLDDVYLPLRATSVGSERGEGRGKDDRQ